MVTLKTENQGYLTRCPLVNGVLIAFLVQLVLILLLALLLHFTGLSDSYLNFMSTIAVIIGVSGGGMSAAKTAESRFLLNGLGVGILCLVIVLLISLFSGKGLDLTNLGVRSLSYLGAGTVGGMLGALLTK
ncbi:MAG: TIGR04086 family membrane protein [Clostridia bacterium]|nr:TIGR04086 family membrane protein [Clostridia bacterium]